MPSSYGRLITTASPELGNRVIESRYSLHRLHGSLGYRSPAEYENAFGGLTTTPMVSVKAEQP